MDDAWNERILIQGREYLNYAHHQCALDLQEIECQASCFQPLEIFRKEFYLFMVAYIQ